MTRAHFLRLFALAVVLGVFDCKKKSMELVPTRRDAPIEPPHRPIAEALLKGGNMDVYLDPRLEGAKVPPQFRKNTRLILKVGYKMPVPIPDLKVTDTGISGTLSFNREPFFCDVPWSTVFALVGDDGRGMVWHELTPLELRDAAAKRLAEEKKD